MDPITVEVIRCRLLFCKVAGNPAITVLECNGDEYTNDPVKRETYTLSANKALSMRVLNNKLITKYTSTIVPAGWLEKGIDTMAEDTVFFWLSNIDAVQHGVEAIFYGTEDLRPCYGRPAYQVDLQGDGIILLRKENGDFSIFYPPTSQLIKWIEYDRKCS